VVPFWFHRRFSAQAYEKQTGGSRPRFGRWLNTVGDEPAGLLNDAVAQLAAANALGNGRIERGHFAPPKRSDCN
jgi:hypothetical protein